MRYPTNQTIRYKLSALLLLTTFLFSSSATAAQQTAETVGILPIPDYSGHLSSRAWLLGDWNGSRTSLANKGVQMNIQSTQTTQSIINGGRNEHSEFGGSLDYNMTLDLQKMGIAPGAIVKFRVESRYGDTVNQSAGPLLPVNTDGYFPLSSDDNITAAVTSLHLIQFLSEQFAVIIGKVDTLDGDLTEFASGRGVTQFQNAAFVFNPVAGLTVPYSALATGFLWLPNSNTEITSTFMNAQDASTTSGFDDFGDGWLWSTEIKCQYQNDNKPGGMGISFLYAGDNDFLELGGRLSFDRNAGLDVATENESWYASWNVWQYLFTEEDHDGAINLLDGTPDLQGFGLFSRVGIADDKTNPIDWSASIGLGGRGIFSGRNDDTFGVGYFYSSIQSGLVLNDNRIDNSSEGGELFYNIALTPATALTLNSQVVKSPFSNVDTAVILGMRLNLKF